MINKYIVSLAGIFISFSALADGLTPTVTAVTRPQFEVSPYIANTSWATQHGLQPNGFYILTADGNLPISHMGGESIFAAGSTITETMPDISLVPAGAQHVFLCAIPSGCTVQGFDGDQIIDNFEGEPSNTLAIAVNNYATLTKLDATSISEGVLWAAKLDAPPSSQLTFGWNGITVHAESSPVIASNEIGGVSIISNTGQTVTLPDVSALAPGQAVTLWGTSCGNSDPANTVSAIDGQQTKPISGSPSALTLQCGGTMILVSEPGDNAWQELLGTSAMVQSKDFLYPTFQVGPIISSFTTPGVIVNDDTGQTSSTTTPAIGDATASSIVVGSPTAGGCGGGCVNAEGLRVNGTPVAVNVNTIVNDSLTVQSGSHPAGAGPYIQLQAASVMYGTISLSGRVQGDTTTDTAVTAGSGDGIGFYPNFSGSPAGRFDASNGFTLSSLSGSGSTPVITDLNGKLARGSLVGPPFTMDMNSGPLTSVSTTIFDYLPVASNSVFDKMTVTARVYDTCGTPPVVTAYDCPDKTSNCSGGSALSSATVSSTTGNGVDGTNTGSTITAGHYIGIGFSAGVCAGINVTAHAYMHNSGF